KDGNHATAKRGSGGRERRSRGIASGAGALESRELLARVDVQESVGLVVEGDFHDRERRIPAVDLSLAAREEVAQRPMDRSAHEAEYGMRLVARPRDGELGIGLRERAAQARDEIRGQERRIARRGDDELASGVRETALEARERAGEALDLVGDHAV